MKERRRANSDVQAPTGAPFRFARASGGPFWGQKDEGGWSIPKGERAADEAFGLGMLLPERRIGLWAAGTLWLSAHAIFHFWEVAAGICSRDIGIIQLFIGVAFGLGVLLPERRIGLWAAGALWLSAHAIFHFWEVAAGICSPSVIPRDFPAVNLPAILGIVLTLWAVRHSPAEKIALA